MADILIANAREFQESFNWVITYFIKFCQIVIRFLFGGFFGFGLVWFSFLIFFFFFIFNIR